VLKAVQEIDPKQVYVEQELPLKSFFWTHLFAVCGWLSDHLFLTGNALTLGRGGAWLGLVKETWIEEQEFENV
jgi:hypothetical protein